MVGQCKKLYARLYDTSDLFFFDIADQSLLLTLVLYIQVYNGQISCSSKIAQCSTEKWLCSQRMDKEQPCAGVRKKWAEEHPCQASALPLNLAKVKPSVYYLFKRDGGPAVGKKKKKHIKSSKIEDRCIPFPPHAASRQLEKMPLFSLKACRDVSTAGSKAAAQQQCL